MEQLKKGYKKTEVGVIPDDWDVKTIEEIFKFYSTSNFSKAEMFFDGEVGCIHYGLIHAIPNTSYSLENGIKYYITSEQAKYEFVKDGDVVMVDASEDLVGINKSVELKNVNGKKYISGLHTYLLRDVNAILADNYRGQILNSYLIKTQLLRFAVGMKVFGVSKPQLKQILIPIPTITEQKAISNALTDVDELITNLEKLIAKKKAIKQGAMQQLLTPPQKGGKRLDGFSGDWVEMRLGDIANFFSGGTPSTSNSEYYNGFIPWISSGELNNIRINQTNGFISRLGLENSSAKIVEKGTLLLAMYGATAGVCAITNIVGAINQAVLAIVPENYNSEYLFQFLRLNKEFIIKTYTQGGQPNLSGNVVKSIQAFFPASIEEQNEIANILFEMDLDIETLDKKLNKTNLVKQGMMQELLTGKTRLI